MSKSRISMIHHVNYGITDIERSKEWYEKVFGIERKDLGPESSDRMLEMFAGPGEFHLYKNPDPSRPINHVAIEITDWDEMIANLKEMGVPLEDDIGSTLPSGGFRSHDGSSYAYIRDPAGNLIEILHHPKRLRCASPAS
ncbi:MAG: VOC family protein [Dehalococcoidia bacterium]|nr:VOC family protein [Dehalococcoidia bacterium]